MCLLSRIDHSTHISDGPEQSPLEQVEVAISLSKLLGWYCTGQGHGFYVGTWVVNIGYTCTRASAELLSMQLT